MNTLVLVLSYIVLLLVVAVGYLLWNNRKLNRMTDNMPDEINELWRRTGDIKKVINDMPHHAVPWSAFENFQEAANSAIDRVERNVKELELKVFPSKYPPVEGDIAYLHTNPEDSHATE